VATPRAISPDGIEGDVKAAQRGDLDAYGRIFVRFQDIAFAVALARLREPAVAQDVAQEAPRARMLRGRTVRGTRPSTWPGVRAIRRSSRRCRGPWRDESHR